MRRPFILAFLLSLAACSSPPKYENGYSLEALPGGSGSFSAAAAGEKSAAWKELPLPLAVSGTTLAVLADLSVVLRLEPASAAAPAKLTGRVRGTLKPTAWRTATEPPGNGGQPFRIQIRSAGDPPKLLARIDVPALVVAAGSGPLEISVDVPLKTGAPAEQLFAEAAGAVVALYPARWELGQPPATSP
jgi:hypothetical protein